MLENMERELNYSKEKLKSLIEELEKANPAVSAIVQKDEQIGYVRGYNSELIGKPIDYLFMAVDNGSGMECRHCWNSGDLNQTLPNITILIRNYEKIVISDETGKVYSFGFKKSNDGVKNVLIIFKTGSLLSVIATDGNNNTVNWLDLCTNEEKPAICSCIEKMLDVQPNVKGGDYNESQY